MSIGVNWQTYGLDLVVFDEIYLDPQVMDGSPPRGLNAATHYATTRWGGKTTGAPKKAGLD